MSDHSRTMTTSALGNGDGTTESTDEITGLPVRAINDFEPGACTDGVTTGYSNGHGQDNGHETSTHRSSHQAPGTTVKGLEDLTWTGP